MPLIPPAKPPFCVYTAHLIWMIDNVPAKLALFQTFLDQSAFILATSDGRIRLASPGSYWPSVNVGQSRPFAKFSLVHDWSEKTVGETIVQMHIYPLRISMEDRILRKCL